jgi:hypothetical protein
MPLSHKDHKKDKKYLWTNHVCQKMHFYNLSEGRIKRVLRHAKRTEEGIAPDTVASMQRNDTKKRQEEIWVMWSKNKKNQKADSEGGHRAGEAEDNKKFFTHTNKTIIISAWRYPGISPVGKKIPIPENIWEELVRENLI